MRPAFGLLRYDQSENLGDEIQSIAAQQFLPEINATIDRDTNNIIPNMSLPRADHFRVLYNGWFHSQHWKFPPPPNIEPLFISFHINDPDLPPNYKQYLQAHEPIGCRDLHTCKLLERHSIKTYFSGCLTLTLQTKLGRRSDEILVVDAHSMCPDLYMRIIPERIRQSAIHLGQGIKLRLTHAQKMKMARAHLDRIAQARLVITSRLHTALPCLAFGTPVVFLTENLQDVRFGGLVKFLKTFTPGDRLDVDLLQHRNARSDELVNIVSLLKSRVCSWIKLPSPFDTILSRGKHGLVRCCCGGRRRGWRHDRLPGPGGSVHRRSSGSTNEIEYRVV
jgi:hypothetical protein